jgi:hypothetical protein
LSVGDADPLCVGTVAIMHAAASALLSATDESEGLGRNKFRGCRRRAPGGPGAEIASCGLESGRRGQVTAGLVGICARMILAGVVGVAVRV